MNNQNETPQSDFGILRKPNLQEIEGFIIITTVKPTHRPKNFKESRLIWNDSGTRKYCEYDYISDQWYFITMTLVT